jgi:hypothetical protein
MISTSNQPKINKGASASPNADEWFTPGRFAILLGGLIIVCFPKAVFGLETFFYRDFGAFAYPLAFYHREAFWRGEVPLWNPYSNCGLPFLAQWNTLTLYPLSLIYLLFPLSWSLGFFNLAHLFLAGMGMYFLAFRWTENRFAASVAGVIYAFNGLSWTALMWSNDIAALGWLPWVVLTAEKAWQEGGARNVLMAAIIGALQMLAGAPEVIIFTWMALGVLWLIEWLKKGSRRGRMLLRTGGVVILVAGLAAIQFLPFLDLLRNSQRDTSFGDTEWSMPRSGWANFLVPVFHCIPGQLGALYQFLQGWTVSYYLGVGAVALTLMALWRARDRRTLVLGGLTAFSLTMALGDPGKIYTLACKLIPAMGFMRFPVKFVVLAIFAVPLLAARAVSWWQSLPEARWRIERRKLWYVGSACVGAMVIIVLWEWMIRRPPQTNPMVTAQNALSRAAFLISILAALSLLRRIHGATPQRLARISVLSLLWFDVLTHMPNLSPTVARDDGGYSKLEPDLIRQYFKWENQLKLGEARAMPVWTPLARVMYVSAKDKSTDILGRRLSMFCNYNLLDHIPKWDGFYSLNLRYLDDLYRRTATATTNNDVPGMKDFLGISQISSPVNPVGWIARDTFLPMITAGQKPYFVDDQTALKAVVRTKFDPVGTVFLPLEARQTVTATNRAPAKVISSHVEAEHIEAEVDSPAPAMVVVAQAYYHFWHAYVDGKETPLYRANYAFQALEVPAGKHQVRLVYQDRSFFWGAIISLTSLLACAAIWSQSRKSPKSQSLPTAPARL